MFSPFINLTPIFPTQVILATNIAETSVTINGIRHVIDAGWVKVRRYVASTGLDSLRNTHGRYTHTQHAYIPSR